MLISLSHILPLLSLQPCSFPISLRVKARGLTMASGSAYSEPEPALHPSCPLLLLSAQVRSAPITWAPFCRGRVFALAWTVLPLDGWGSPVPLLQVWKAILHRRTFLTALPRTATSPATLLASLPLIVLYNFSYSFFHLLSPSTGI